MAATYFTDNELGTAALLLVAGVFLMCATFAIVPTRLRIGDNEVSVGRAAMNTLERIVSEADSPTQERTLETFEEELAVRGVQRTTNEAVASMLDRFIRYSGSELPRILHDALLDAGWVPSTPSKSTYIRWTFSGKEHVVNVYQNSAQIVIAANRLVDVVLGMPGVVHRTTKNEVVVSYASGVDDAMAVIDAVQRYADGVTAERPSASASQS